MGSARVAVPPGLGATVPLARGGRLAEARHLYAAACAVPGAAVNEQRAQGLLDILRGEVARLRRDGCPAGYALSNILVPLCWLRLPPHMPLFARAWAEL